VITVTGKFVRSHELYDQENAGLEAR